MPLILGNSDILGPYRGSCTLLWGLCVYYQGIRTLWDSFGPSRAFIAKDKGLDPRPVDLGLITLSSKTMSPETLGFWNPLFWCPRTRVCDPYVYVVFEALFHHAHEAWRLLGVKKLLELLLGCSGAS